MVNKLNLKLETKRVLQNFVVGNYSFCSRHKHIFSIKQVINKAVFLVAFVGNRGTFQCGLRKMLSDKELVQHSCYFGFGILGLTVHEFFYSILVSQFLNIQKVSVQCLTALSLLQELVTCVDPIATHVE